jgi:alpha-galactosidase
VYSRKDSLETWVKPLAHDEWAVCFLNRSQKPMPVNFNWKENSLSDSSSKKSVDFKTTVYKIKDLWKKTNLANTSKSLVATIPAHDVIMLRLTKQEKK